jgi:poly(3-hydroxybutyrate) depolymerase
MTASRHVGRTLAAICLASFSATFSIGALAQETLQIAGAACASPPVLHCPDSECPGTMVINQGPAVEMKTRRTYFLDYPCDVKKGEPVTLVLSLHGGGSYGNWQRHYFPAMDFKDRYRLVIATPNSPIRVWSEADDEYLQNIVSFLIEQIGRANIRAFWLVGHSQGGMTSNRLVRTDFFKSKVDGWLSLSGGRLGGQPERSEAFTQLRLTVPSSMSTMLSPSTMAAAAAALREPPSAEFSHIYATGEFEIKALPDTSEWATKYGCGARGQAQETADTRAGYVFDSTRLVQLNKAWGLLPGAGKAQISTFPNCKGGRVVADVVRINKGHTEGLEPKITEELIKMIVAAPGGKIQGGG